MTERTGFVSVTEAAQRLAVGRGTVRLWVQKGLLQPARRLPGGRYDLREDEVQRFEQSLIDQARPESAA